jgi:hypothetical protein
MTSIRSRLRAPERTAAPGYPHRPDPVLYVYGIAAPSAVIPASIAGIGGSPHGVSLVSFQRVAAITSAVSPDQPLGTPDDLRAHARVLDVLSALMPVLPMRFGGVMTDHQAVVDELLAPYHDEFAALLDVLRGHDQFTVKGRYLGDTALRETLLADPETLALRNKLHGTDPADYRNDRIRLGELIARSLDRQRVSDTEELVEQLAPRAAAVAQPNQGGRSTGVRVSFLVERSRTRDFEAAVEELGKHWEDRIRVQLLGPLAPYDFAYPLPETG